MSSPKLPEPFRKQGQRMSYDGDDKVFFDCYTISQMKDFGKLCRLYALEEAAVFFDSKNQGWHTDTDAAVASEIRRLK